MFVAGGSGLRLHCDAAQHLISLYKIAQRSSETDDLVGYMVNSDLRSAESLRVSILGPSDSGKSCLLSSLSMAAQSPYQIKGEDSEFLRLSRDVTSWLWDGRPVDATLHSTEISFTLIDHSIGERPAMRRVTCLDYAGEYAFPTDHAPTHPSADNGSVEVVAQEMQTTTVALKEHTGSAEAALICIPPSMGDNTALKGLDKELRTYLTILETSATFQRLLVAITKSELLAFDSRMGSELLEEKLCPQKHASSEFGSLVERIHSSLAHSEVGRRGDVKVCFVSALGFVNIRNCIVPNVTVMKPSAKAQVHMLIPELRRVIKDGSLIYRPFHVMDAFAYLAFGTESRHIKRLF